MPTDDNHLDILNTRSRKKMATQQVIGIAPRFKMVRYGITSHLTQQIISETGRVLRTRPALRDIHFCLSVCLFLSLSLSLSLSILTAIFQMNLG